MAMEGAGISVALAVRPLARRPVRRQGCMYEIRIGTSHRSSDPSTFPTTRMDVAALRKGYMSLLRLSYTRCRLWGQQPTETTTLARKPD